jgi:hypothetical protein
VLDCDSTSFYEGTVTVDYQMTGPGILLFSKNVIQFEELEIYGMGGGLVYEKSGGLSEALDLRGLSAGAYVIRFGNTSKFQVLKVILF